MWAGCAASVRVMEPSAHPGTEQSFTAHGKKTDLNRPTVSDGRTWNSYLMRRDWTQGNKIFFCFMSLTSTWPWNPLVVEDLISSDADRGSILSFFLQFFDWKCSKTNVLYCFTPTETTSVQTFSRSPTETISWVTEN